MIVFATKSNEILAITMKFQKGVQTVSAKELRSVKLDKHITRRMHRVQRSEDRAERLVFLAKDNRHTCVTRVT